MNEHSTSGGGSGFEHWRAELLEVVREHAYTRSEVPFQLSSGGTSNDYVDMRRGVARGEALQVAANAVLTCLSARSIDFEAIGGMTMGADPVAHAVALVGNKAWFSVRKQEKGHGARQRIEGTPIDAQSKVVLFEDTVSTGRSILDALDVVEETGASVVAALTLLDRGDKARALFTERGVTYVAVLTYADLGIVAL